MEVNGETVISSEEGFAAMYEFLKTYWSQLKSADVGDVLSDMQPAYGGQSSDPAAWFDWLRAVEKVRSAGG